MMVWKETAEPVPDGASGFCWTAWALAFAPSRLMRTTADKLVERVEREVARQSDPVAQADTALRTVLATFSGHRTMARLLIVDALGAGRDFRAEIEHMHARFAGLIEGYLDQAIADGIIEPIDTRIAAQAWFGALNEVVTRWLVAERAGPLEDAYPALRRVLFRGVGIDDERIGRLDP